jgi:aspartate aminotransferase-like enzyme
MNASLPYRLLAPGPVPVPQAVLKRMSEKVLHHRTPAFEKLLIESWAGLKYVFQTRQPVQIIAGTGTAAMEAAVVNSLSPRNEALVIVSGKFGERWVEICERYGITTHKLNVEWGSAASEAKLQEALKKIKNVKAVFTQVCETSTATVHSVRQLSQVVRKEASQALFVVDAITAVGCMPLPMDEWELDIVIAGSQKAFMIPTGLSFVALSEKAWRAQAQSTCAKFYLDLAAEKKANDRKETHFSTPTPLIVGLHAVLQQMQQVGMQKVIERCELLAGFTRTYGERLGLMTYSESPSSSVTALRTPDGIDSAKLRDWLEKEKNITIMGGQDQLKGKIIRVGHMGDVRDDDMFALLAALKEYMKSSEDISDAESKLKQVPTLFP